MSISLLDWIELASNPDRDLDLEKFKYIRNHGTAEELKEAVEKMEAMGGYEALASVD